MGLGNYCFCELDSVQKDNPRFVAAFKQLEAAMITKCNTNWAPKTCGFAKPGAGQYGRVPILPELFDDHSDTQMVTWRQGFTVAGHQTLITGTRTGNTIPEDFKVGLIGIAFPNKQQHITEIKMQIGDRKYGRINLEEMHQYNKPAIIFEEGFEIDEETAFDLYGYVEGPIPAQAPFINTIYQRIVLLGAAYYKYIDKVLGQCGAAI
jgi:hypothetical protein